MAEPFKIRICRDCGQVFGSLAALRQHRRDKHTPEHEPSIAERMIEAELEEAMGLPVEDDWLLESRP